MLNTILKILVIVILLPFAAGTCVMCGVTMKAAEIAAEAEPPQGLEP